MRCETRPSRGMNTAFKLGGIVMKIFTKVSEISEYVSCLKKEGRTIGFVPTMGYLHEGHVSLAEYAKAENDVVGMSIFVNPTQFGPNEDFDKYPRDLERDFNIAAGAGVDFVFVPPPSEMYPEDYKTYVEVYDITEKLCGRTRPGHFRGVTTVVLKLLNISGADRAYFGEKDAQQLAVIKRMVRDLNLNVKIIGCPIVREADNLAKSSRNVYLSKEERVQALSLSRSLFMARAAAKGGQRSADEIKKLITGEISKQPLAKIDYVSVVGAEDLEDVKVLSGSVLIALAVYFGKTRLIDNIVVEV